MQDRKSSHTNGDCAKTNVVQCILSLLTLYSTETEPRCSSPVDSGSSDVDKQAKHNHKKSGEWAPPSSELRSLIGHQLQNSFFPPLSLPCVHRR